MSNTRPVDIIKPRISYRSLFLFRVLICTLIGYVAARNYIDDTTYLLMALPIISLVSWLIPRRYFVTKSLLLHVLVIVISVFIYKNSLSSDCEDIERSQARVILHIMDFAQEGKKVKKVTARLLAVDDHIIVKCPKVELLWLDQRLRFSPGDTLIATSSIERLNRTDNSYGFDYNQYLMDRGISYRLWVNDVLLIRQMKDASLIRRVQWLVRKKALGSLERHLNADVYGLCGALILGYKNDLSQEVRQAFMNTGAMHILAVSGMHVGLLAIVLSWVLERCIPGFIGKKLFIGLLMSIFLIMYGLITGGAAPVVRAVSIYIAFFLLNLSERDKNGLNILSGIALIMLIAEPGILFQLAFQFSFLAVASIIIFFPYFDRNISPRNKSIRVIWQVIAMSLAVQFLVMPLSAYTFHQIPLTFPLSSLIGIGFAYLMIPLGFLAMSSGSFILYNLLELLGEMMIASIQFLESFDYLIVTNIAFGQLSLALIYLSIIGLICYLYQRKALWLHLAVIFIISFVVNNTVDTYCYKNQEFVRNYYSENGIPAIDLILGETAIEYRSNQSENKKIEFAITNFRTAHRIKDVRKEENIKVSQSDHNLLIVNRLMK